MSKTFEARLSGTAGDRFDWTVGAFWYQGEFTNSQQVSIPAFVPTALLVNGQNTTSSENLSGFAHGVFHVTDKFSLTAGVRYSTDQKDEEFDNSIVVTQLDTDESHFDWKAGIDYKFTDSFMAYASAATSYRPQAFNPRPFQVTQFVGVDGEEATSYEIGFKSDLADNRLRINLAAFYVDYNQRILPIGGTECLANSAGEYINIVPEGTPGAVQDSLGQWCVDPNGPPPPGATTSRTFYNNIPATIQGAEFEFQWVPIDGLTISGQYGYTDFQGDEFDDPSLLGNPAVTDITSDNPIYVPTDNWSLSFAYRFGGSGDRGSFTPRRRLLRSERDLQRHSHQRDADRHRHHRGAGLLAGLRVAQCPYRVGEPRGHLAYRARCDQHHRRGVLLQQVRPHGVRPADARRSAGSSARVVRAVHPQLQLS